MEIASVVAACEGDILGPGKYDSQTLLCPTVVVIGWTIIKSFQSLPVVSLPWLMIMCINSIPGGNQHSKLGVLSLKLSHPAFSSCQLDKDCFDLSMPFIAEWNSGKKPDLWSWRWLSLSSISFLGYQYCSACKLINFRVPISLSIELGY